MTLSTTNRYTFQALDPFPGSWCFGNSVLRTWSSVFREFDRPDNGSGSHFVISELSVSLEFCYSLNKREELLSLALNGSLNGFFFWRVIIMIEWKTIWSLDGGQYITPCSSWPYSDKGREHSSSRKQTNYCWLYGRPRLRWVSRHTSKRFLIKRSFEYKAKICYCIITKQKRPRY